MIKPKFMLLYLGAMLLTSAACYSQQVNDLKLKDYRPVSIYKNPQTSNPSLRLRAKRSRKQKPQTGPMKFLLSILTLIIINPNIAIGQEEVRPQDTIPLLVRKCPDFDLTGKGDNNAWNKTEWNYMTKLDTGGKAYSSKFKILYSAKGIYVLFYGDDDKISTQFDKDFENLFRGDVFEVFFHTDPKTTIYLEYEVNQLNKELVLLIPKINGRAQGWIPWHYEKDRKVKKMVNVVGNKKNANAAITSWSAELFFPYDLFSPLGNVPPTSGTFWNANFYRLDYDSGKMIKWAWGPVKKSFHELEKFRVIQFE